VWAKKQRDEGTEEPVRYLLHPAHLKEVERAYRAKAVDPARAWHDEPNCVFERIGYVLHLPRKQPNHAFVANAPFNEHALEMLPVMRICLDSDVV